MRLFVAIDLGETMRARIAQALPAWKEASPKSKWVPVENVHLTLAFLGHLDEGLVPKLAAALDGAAARHAPLHLEVGGGGSFGSKKRPRVLWLGVSEPRSPHLADLVKDVEAALQPLGYVPEARAYHPHVTLARARDPRGDGALADCVPLLSGLVPTPVRAGELILMKSTTAPTGARYEPLHRSPLAG